MKEPKSSARAVIIIDGRSVTTDATHSLLQAMETTDSHVPVLCHDPRLAPRGTCGICMVEVRSGEQWRKTPACATRLDGIEEVRTRSPALTASRRWTLELLIARHSASARFYPDRVGDGRKPPMVCACRGHPTCVLRSACLQVQAMPLSTERAPREDAPVLLRAGIELEMSKCILCDRCVRICREVKGVEALSLAGRGHEATVVYAKPASTALVEACDACERTGALCIDTCPTDALRPVRNPRLKVVDP